MRIYRFGLKFKSKRELGNVLDLAPYGNQPCIMPDGSSDSVYLSERDIINRMMKHSGYSSEEEAKTAFYKLVETSNPRILERV